MTEKFLNRIIKKAGCPDIMEALTERLSLPDLQSLLLEVYRKRSDALTPAWLMKQFGQNRFGKPSPFAPQDRMAFDRLAFSLIPEGFEAMELSPVCPLGTCSALATVDQNNVLTTIRNSEVTADPTNVMALESASRRKAILRQDPKSAQKVRLCASHRALRTQFFDMPGAFPHFQLFCMVTAGRDEGAFLFETQSLKEQIDFYLRLLALTPKLGLSPKNIRVKLTALDERRMDVMQKEIITPLKDAHPHIRGDFDQERMSGRGYYIDACFQIWAEEKSGENFMLIDGGITDWTQQLTGSKKERLLISGLGSERLCICFRE